jgi:hypothetical protein
MADAEAVGSGISIGAITWISLIKQSQPEMNSTY